MSNGGTQAAAAGGERLARLEARMHTVERDVGRQGDQQKELVECVGTLTSTVQAVERDVKRHGDQQEELVSSVRELTRKVDKLVTVGNTAVLLLSALWAVAEVVLPLMNGKPIGS